MPFPKLTDDQVRPLFALISYQHQQGRDVIFHLTDGDEIKICPWQTEEPVATVPGEFVSVWQDCGYVVLGQRPFGGGPFGYTADTLVLSSAAIGYEARMCKPPVIRALLDALDEWGKDLRAAVVGGIFSLLVAVIARGLGL